MSAVDYFLLLDGIPGDSHDPRHRGEIEVESFTWGESLPVTTGIATGGQTRTGRVTIRPLVVRARTGTATPELLLACASGRLVAQGRLAGRSSEGPGEDFLTITLTRVQVTSLTVAAEQPGGAPTDEVALSFDGIAMSVAPVAPVARTGAIAAPVTAQWPPTGAARPA